MAFGDHLSSCTGASITPECLMIDLLFQGLQLECIGIHSVTLDANSRWASWSEIPRYSLDTIEFFSHAQVVHNVRH
jgi:hypothetical protein